MKIFTRQVNWSTFEQELRDVRVFVAYVSTSPATTPNSSSADSSNGSSLDSAMTATACNVDVASDSSVTADSSCVAAKPKRRRGGRRKRMSRMQTAEGIQAPVDVEGCESLTDGHSSSSLVSTAAPDEVIVELANLRQMSTSPNSLAPILESKLLTKTAQDAGSMYSSSSSILIKAGSVSSDMADDMSRCSSCMSSVASMSAGNLSRQGSCSSSDLAIMVKQYNDQKCRNIPNAKNKHSGLPLGDGTGVSVLGYVVFDPLYEDGVVVGYMSMVMCMQPNAHTGTIKLVFQEAMSAFKAEGKQRLNLGGMPGYATKPGER